MFDFLSFILYLMYKFLLEILLYFPLVVCAISPLPLIIHSDQSPLALNIIHCSFHRKIIYYNKFISTLPFCQFIFCKIFMTSVCGTQHNNRMIGVGLFDEKEYFHYLLPISHCFLFPITFNCLIMLIRIFHSTKHSRY